MDNPPTVLSLLLVQHYFPLWRAGVRIYLFVRLAFVTLSNRLHSSTVCLQSFAALSTYRYFVRDVLLHFLFHRKTHSEAYLWINLAQIRITDPGCFETFFWTTCLRAQSSSPVGSDFSTVD
jgi:hypothetical protein